MILGIVQARSGSTRLPDKVLMPILGEPMLARQCERLGRANRLDRLVVATSEDPSDDRIASLCAALGVGCHRGSLEDVLDRFYQAARSHAPEHVVRLTGDCPLVDPTLVDEVIGVHLRDGNDYTSNVLDRTYPDGLDVEVLRMEVLETAWREARLPSEREHVTPFVNQHPERFSQGYVKQARDLSALRWSVDEPADFELITRIYERLYPQNPSFATADILALLASEPEWQSLNADIPINEGLEKSREADARFLDEERGAGA